MMVQNILTKNSNMNNNINTESRFNKNTHKKNIAFTDASQKLINNKLATDEQMKKKIAYLTYQLKVNQASEQQAQTGMSALQEKKEGLEEINAIGEKLKELAGQYNSSNLSDEDKGTIKSQADELINDLDKVMNNTKFDNKSIMGTSTVNLLDSGVTMRTITSNSFSIKLDLDCSDTTKFSMDEKPHSNPLSDDHFYNDLSTDTILENPNIIKEKIINPVQKAIKDVNTAESTVYDIFTNEYAAATESVNKLFKLGAISIFQYLTQEAIQKALFTDITSIRFQASNINKDNVALLLK